MTLKTRNPRIAAFYLLALFLLAVTPCGFGQRKAEEKALEVITPELMREYVGFLASDSLKGRETPSPGLEEAGWYIARQFSISRLKPLNADFFQDLSYCYLDLGNDVFVTLVRDPEVKNFQLKTDFIPFEFSGTKPAEGGIVFAGYGITAPDYGYDDYKDLDVQGKIVVILRQEPGQSDTTQPLFRGKDLTHYAGLKEKQANASEHGAAGMIVVSGPLTYQSLRPRGYSWPALSKVLPRDALPLVPCDQPGKSIPVVSAGDSIISDFFGSPDSLRHIQERIDRTMQPVTFAIPGTLAMNIAFTEKPLGGRNVIGFIPGADPVLREEAVIIGGHYDHVGYLKQHKADTDYIFNGADDNASGTSGVMAVARAFSAMEERPKRSVIFIAFAGEEKGLLGSASYVNDPLWPLDKTVAMLNLDMISRNDPDTLEIIGARQNPDLIRIIRKQNRKTGFFLKESKSNRMDGGSDHTSFYHKGIPALFFFTGLHKDYHQVTDNPDRTDPVKAARVAKLAFLSAWTISNERRHYKVILPAKQDD